MTQSRPDVTETTVRRLVELASRAPSVHNSQPWSWLWDGHVLELRADRSRQLGSTDPVGRNLVISCGAALHHLAIAAEALGSTPDVVRFPDPDESDLLARITLGPGTPDVDAATIVGTIEDRCTDRRRFTSWPVPDERLLHLCSHARAAGTRAMPLLDVSERFQTELLINRAIDLQQRDHQVRQEQATWIEHGSSDGLPAVVVPSRHDLVPNRPSRFSGGRLDDDAGREVEGSDGLIVIYDSHDDPSTWLRAGEALSAIWLAATVEGLSIVPLSSLVEVDETRRAMQIDVLGGLAQPLLIARVGWQPISRAELPRTPRRPVDEILSVT